MGRAASQSPTDPDELGSLLRMQPRVEDIDAFGNEVARLAAVVRLANVLVLAVGLAMVPTRLLPAGAAELAAISHWPSDQRDLVLVDHTGQEGWEAATRRAVDQWNAAGADVHLTWEAGDGSCDEEGPRIAFCLAEGSELAGFVEHQGVMTPSTSHGHASGALVEVCSDCGLGDLERQLVATHEIGHALGLPHSQRFSSVMYPDGGTGELDDLDGPELRRLYAHDD